MALGDIVEDLKLGCKHLLLMMYQYTSKYFLISITLCIVSVDLPDYSLVDLTNHKKCMKEAVRLTNLNGPAVAAWDSRELEDIIQLLLTSHRLLQRCHEAMEKGGYLGELMPPQQTLDIELSRAQSISSMERLESEGSRMKWHAVAILLAVLLAWALNQ